MDITNNQVIYDKQIKFAYDAKFFPNDNNKIVYYDCNYDSYILEDYLPLLLPGLIPTKQGKILNNI